MFKISLTELEEVRRDPAAFKKKKDIGTVFRGNNSYFQTLKRAIYEYHKDQSSVAAMNYLEDGLESFKNHAKCEKTIEDLQWYIAEYQNLGWATFLKKHNISIPLSTQYLDSLKVTGEIGRIDTILMRHGFSTREPRGIGKMNYECLLFRTQLELS
jgi:hypothetical protein